MFKGYTPRLQPALLNSKGPTAHAQMIQNRIITEEIQDYCLGTLMILLMYVYVANVCLCFLTGHLTQRNINQRGKETLCKDQVSLQSFIRK